MIPASSLKRINKLQKKAVRAIAGASYLAHTGPLFKKLKILPIQDIIQFNILVFLSSYKWGKLPETFAGTWKSKHEVNSNYNLRNASYYFCEKVRCNSLLKHPLFNFPSLWNSFKDDIQYISSISLIKSSLKKSFIEHLDDSPCTIFSCYACSGFRIDLVPELPTT